jgi:hypothetical protein
VLAVRARAVGAVNRVELSTLVLGVLVGTLASVRAKRPIVSFAVGFVTAATWVASVRAMLT